MAVELIPKGLIAGMLRGQMVPTGVTNALIPPDPTQSFTRDSINRIWAEVVREYPSYQSLQFDPSGRGAAFVGESGPEDLVVMQPQLLQVRTPVELGVIPAAKKAASVFKIILHHLTGAPPLQLGVKLIFHSPSPGILTAVDFIRTQLISGEDDLAILSGGMVCQAGIKVVLANQTPDPNENYTYTVLIEPLATDANLLYIDCDAQFPGFVDVNGIQARIEQTNEFVDTHVRTFLERRSAELS